MLQNRFELLCFFPGKSEFYNEGVPSINIRFVVVGPGVFFDDPAPLELSAGRFGLEGDRTGGGFRFLGTGLNKTVILIKGNDV